jgi:hypothetical protein
MTDISEPGAFGLAGEAERLAFITRKQGALVLEEAESAELEARAFSQDRAAAGLRSATASRNARNQRCTLLNDYFDSTLASCR